MQIHVGLDIRQTNCPQDTRGHLGGFRGSSIQKSGKAGPLAPTLVHVSGFIWKWTWAKYKSPLNTQGVFRGGGGVGCHKFKSLGNLSLGKQPNGRTDWQQIRYTSVDSSGNGHRLIRPTIPHGRVLGRGDLGGQQLKSLGNVVKWLDRLGIHFAHIMQVNLGMDTG